MNYMTNSESMNMGQIVDCGHRLGLNGVDNGGIWLSNVLIPRDTA
ncbi:hypothetical protein KP509_27G041300 [Ceratopteris richardii]|nr:hypothetical protein KP509_27G041300 [Ceratopteris richardii]